MITDINALMAAIGGGEDEKPVTNQHRKDFMDYQSFLDKRGKMGHIDLDKNGLGKNLLTRYMKENPGTSLTPDHIIPIQNDMSKAYPDESTVIDGLHSSATGKKYPEGYVEGIDKFGDWAGTTDTKIMAKKLQKLGLVGADQLIEDNPDPKSADSIKHSQSDWKLTAIQHILENAHRLNIRTPAEFDANLGELTRTLDPKYRDALGKLDTINPNFYDVIKNSILPEQWKKFDSQKDVAKK